MRNNQWATTYNTHYGGFAYPSIPLCAPKIIVETVAGKLKK